MGLAPAFLIAITVAKKVFEGTITSPPFTSNDSKINSRAEVPLLHPTAKSVPIYSAKLFSKTYPKLKEWNIIRSKMDINQLFQSDISKRLKIIQK